MTARQYIWLWSCAQDVPQSEIEHLGRGKACLAQAELFSGQRSEIWDDGKGNYYHCIVGKAREIDGKPR